MATVYVSFAADGRVTVEPDEQAVLAGQKIYWYVSTANSSIKKIRIQFKTSTAFFPMPDGSSSTGITVPLPGGSAYVWGVAPTPQPGTYQEDAYGVQGLDAAGQPVATLDPKIITIRP